MDFVNALEKQFYFCLTEYNYRCGVYLPYANEVEYMKNVRCICELVRQISNNNELLNDSIDVIRYSKYDSCVRFKNGNFIKIVQASDSARGNKFTGMIVDEKIDINVMNCIVYPSLIPLRCDKEHFFKLGDKPMERVYRCDITKSFHNRMCK